MEFSEIKEEMAELALDVFREHLMFSIDDIEEFDADTLVEELELAVDGHQWVVYSRYHWEICPHAGRTGAEDYLDGVGIDAIFDKRGFSGVLMSMTYAILREIAIGFLVEIVDLVEEAVDNETPLDRNSSSPIEREVAATMMNCDVWWRK